MVLEIIVIEAPVLKSPPYAAGYTMVFIPKGVAKHMRARVRTVSFTPSNFKIITKSAGINMRRNIEAMYTFFFIIRLLRLYPPITKPARIIATGPIQFPAFERAVSTKDGI